MQNLQQDHIVARLHRSLTRPKKATHWAWEYFNIYTDNVDPLLAVCNLCFDKALKSYESNVIPLEAFWEVKYGKQKSTTKLSQHLYFNHKTVHDKHSVPSIASTENVSSMLSTSKHLEVVGPMDSYTLRSEDYFVGDYLRWIVEKSLPLNTGDDQFFRQMMNLNVH